MWIKRLLVILPVGLLVFLVASVLFVPGVADTAENEYRNDRIVLYMGSNPNDMNPWSSSTTSDSTIYTKLYEGLLDYDKDFRFRPQLARWASIRHVMVAPVPAGMTPAEFETKLRDSYGKQLVRYTEQAPTGKKSWYLLPEDAKIAPSKMEAAPGESDRAVEYTPPAIVEIELALEPREGEIISAVDTETVESLLKTNRRNWFKRTAGLPGDALTEEAIEKLMKAAGVPEVKHSPRVDMLIRKGIYWTDGPFFSAPERTWNVSIDGLQIAPVVADSESAAIELVRNRHDPDNKKGLEIKAWNYEETFGDIEEGGPWWGKSREMQAIDAKQTFELIKTPEFRSPRLSSYMDITDVKLDPDNPYWVSIEYGRLYSPALYNLSGSLLPYHTWNLTAWKDEAIRKDRGPKELGIDERDYDVMVALPTEERDYRHKPSSIGYMVLEPLNGEERPLWRIGERVTMRRNEFYFGRKPEYKFMDYYVFDPALGRETSEVVFNSGGMDLYGAKDYQVDRYKEMTDQYNIIERKTTTYTYIGYNCRKEPLSLPQVRIALTMAMDVEKIMKYVIYGQGQRIGGPAYPVLPWYNPNYKYEHTWLTGENKGKTTTHDYIPYDPVEAKAMLLNAGFTQDSAGNLFWKGERYEMEYINSSGGGPRQDISLLAREEWEKLGITVNYKEYEWNVFIGQYVMPGRYDVLVLGWSGGLSFDKRQLFHSDFTPTKGLNFVGYNNPKADKLMEDILKVYDPVKQIEMSHEIFEIIANDAPYSFLFSPYDTIVLDKNIVWRKEVGKNADGTLDLENRPIDHKTIVTAKQPLSFFYPEIKRLKEAPEFTDEDKTR